MSRRSVTLAHDQSEESLAAIRTMKTRNGEDDIRLIDVTKYEWDEPLDYRLPFVITPEGTFQGIEGIKEYVDRPDKFRR